VDYQTKSVDRRKLFGIEVSKARGEEKIMLREIGVIPFSQSTWESGLRRAKREKRGGGPTCQGAYYPGNFRRAGGLRGSRLSNRESDLREIQKKGYESRTKGARSCRTEERKGG